MYLSLNTANKSNSTSVIDSQGIVVYSIDVSANRESEAFYIGRQAQTGFTLSASTQITSGSIDCYLQYSIDGEIFVDVIDGNENVVTWTMDNTDNLVIVNNKSFAESMFGNYRIRIVSGSAVGTIILKLDLGA
jgi:hypothetical protein